MGGKTVNLDAVVLYGRQQQKFSVSGVAAQSAVLPAGVYDVWCDVNCWVAVGPTASTGLTSDTGYVIFAGNVVSVDVRNGDKIGAIAGSAGTLRFHQVG